MSYAGLCGADNIASAVDALFHHQSFDQIIGYTTEGIGSVCGSEAVSVIRRHKLMLALTMLSQSRHHWWLPVQPLTRSKVRCFTAGSNET